MMRRLLLPFAVLAAVLGLTAMTGCGPSADGASLIQTTNQLRATTGARPVVENPVLTAKAQNWANNMATQQRLYHSTLTDGVGSLRWYALGENIAYAPDGSDVMLRVHNMFVASPGHYANLVNPAYNAMGVGVARDARGTVWVCEVFAQL